MEGADVYIGFSDTRRFSDRMINIMNDNPIIMTMDACDNLETVKKDSTEATIFTGAKNLQNQIFPYMTRAVL